MKLSATISITALITVGLTVAVLRVISFPASFLVFTLADLLNLLAITAGVFFITRGLDQRRSRDAHLKELALGIMDKLRESAESAVGVLLSANGRKLDLQVDGDRSMLVDLKKASQQLKDLGEVLKRFDPVLSGCEEVGALTEAFGDLRDYLSEATAAETITQASVTDAENRQRKLERNLLSLRLRVIAQ